MTRMFDKHLTPGEKDALRKWKESKDYVAVYPFHERYPGLPALFHVSCDRCDDFGFCGPEDEALTAQNTHRQFHVNPGVDTVKQAAEVVSVTYADYLDCVWNARYDRGDEPVDWPTFIAQALADAGLLREGDHG